MTVEVSIKKFISMYVHTNLCEHGSLTSVHTYYLSSSKRTNPDLFLLVSIVTISVYLRNFKYSKTNHTA